MTIEITYYDTDSGKDRIATMEAFMGDFETEAECFGYLCQKAWNQCGCFEIVDKGELICF